MRLLLARDFRYDADIRCQMVVDAKRVLSERPVTKLLLATDCVGREIGPEILDWAYKRGRLPEEVTLVDRDPRICRIIGQRLANFGYRALDMRNYVNKSH